MTAIQARVDALKSLAFGGISGTYAAVGTPIGHLYRILQIVNDTNADVLISFDGTTDNLFLGAGSFILWDLQTNARSDSTFAISINTQVYAKSSGSPSSGGVYVMGVYGKGE